MQGGQDNFSLVAVYRLCNLCSWLDGYLHTAHILRWPFLFLDYSFVCGRRFILHIENLDFRTLSCGHKAYTGSIADFTFSVLKCYSLVPYKIDSIKCFVVFICFQFNEKYGRQFASCYAPSCLRHGRRFRFRWGNFIVSLHIAIRFAKLFSVLIFVDFGVPCQ